ncbi:MAG: hypothetical protein Q4G45_03035 [Actinomycetia bacterium]|nr:hypothetical protein [Actinomycetes bacterium]
MTLDDMTGLEIVERLVEMGDTRRPASAALIDKTLAAVNLPAAPLYRELLRTDGLDVGTITFLAVKKSSGWRHIVKIAELYDPFIPIGSTGGAHVGWSREEQCWCRFSSDFIRERFSDEAALFRDVADRFVQSFVPHVHVPARPRTVAPLEELVASIPDEWEVPKPRAVSVRDRVHRVFTKTVKVQAPDDYRALFDLCDGFEVNGLLVYSPRNLADKQLYVVEEGYVQVGIMDDQALVYSALDSQWQVVDAGSYNLDSDDDRFRTFTEMIGVILPARVVDPAPE